MCYQVTLHRMKCDGRPTIQLGNTTLVNPYGTPGPCKCTPPGPNIGPGLKCKDHICCWSLKYWVPCDDDFCSSTANVSSYVQHPYQVQPSRLAWDFYPILDADHIHKVLCVDVLRTHDRAPTTGPFMQMKISEMTEFADNLRDAKEVLAGQPNMSLEERAQVWAFCQVIESDFNTAFRDLVMLEL
ncbi:hypothetical protein N3K66_004788 [Trichothecium roseum]|uniref:Uncharacterized protein n=1 Tax=Trichothecium roseum TaxID=47278 RepID=A0ACC0V427_9HYPO|nr:hypothetical protein N3K66_004788 [Trichothecium roseum]